MSKLYIISTPIGNMEDITLRALRVLKEVDEIAGEDTRVTKTLLQKLDIPYPSKIYSYRDQNEEKMSGYVIERIKSGQSVALLTDAGTPGVSDPGYRLVSKAREQGIEIEVLPGASAPVTALIASGLPFSSFTFKGFPPRKPGQLRRFFEAEKDLPHSVIFFESKFRLVKSLEAAKEVLGNRIACVCIELTKKFEEINRNNIASLIDHYKKHQPKGEITVVISGSNPKFTEEEHDEEEQD